MAMDMETLRARINLLVLVPLLEDILQGDAEAAGLCAGWNCVVQLQAGADGPAVHLKFAGGHVEAVPGAHERPTLLMDFGSPRNLNANFGAGGERKNPKVLRGKFRIFMLLKMAKLLKFIARYLKPKDEESMTEQARALRARMLLRVSVMGIPEVAANDESAKPLLANVPNGVCQWRILPDGAAMYVLVNQGVFSASKGEAANPSAKVEFKDASAALGVLTGKMNAMKALMGGELAITGQTQIALTLTPLQDKVGKALIAAEKTA